MTMLINTINFRIYIINSSYNLLISLYLLHHNDFITNLLIIYFFIISFPSLFIIVRNSKLKGIYYHVRQTLRMKENK